MNIAILVFLEKISVAILQSLNNFERYIAWKNVGGKNYGEYQASNLPCIVCWRTKNQYSSIRYSEVNQANQIILLYYQVTWQLLVGKRLQNTWPARRRQQNNKGKLEESSTGEYNYFTSRKHVHLFIYLSLSIYPSIFLSIYLSIYLCAEERSWRGQGDKPPKMAKKGKRR